MKEQVFLFGEHRGLIGILSRPDAVAAGMPALLIPNTGLDHRVGPHRLHVQIARAFADSGFPVLRLDLAGQGDSAAPRGKANSIADLAAAMDHLEALGIARHFGVVGLCSGGHDAHQVAVADERIRLAAFVDHYTYPTAAFRMRFWAERLSDPWRILASVRERLTPGREIFGDQVQYFVQPTPEQFSADLSALRSRNASLFYLYTGEARDAYNYTGQLTDRFPELRPYDRLQVHHIPEADHTFSRISMRSELIGLLRNWAREHVERDNPG